MTIKNERIFPTKPVLKRLNFNSQQNDDLVVRTFGKDVLLEARRIAKKPAFQEQLNRLFQTGDDTASRLAAKTRADGKVRKDTQLALAKGLAAVNDPCDELKAFMDHALRIPAGLSREKIELGAHVFRTRFNPLTFFVYGTPCAALQAASAGIAAAAWLTNQPKQRMTLMENIERDDVYTRLVVRFVETFRWFADVSQPGATDPYGPGFQANCRIRLIHAHVRGHMKLDADDWNYEPPLGWRTDELGYPMSAAEGSIVVTTLATAILVARRKLALQVSDEELDALFQFTSYLNYMQGVPEELVQNNAHDATVYFAAYLITMDPHCYYDSVKALYCGIQNIHLEKALFPDSVLAQKVIDGLVMASWHELYGDSHREFYGTRKAPAWASGAYFAIRVLFKGVNLASRHSSWLKRKLDEAGLMLWTDLLPAAETRLKAHFRGVADGVDPIKH